MPASAKFNAIIGAGAVFTIVVCSTLFGAGLKGKQNIRRAETTSKDITVDERIQILEQRRSALVRTKVDLEERLENSRSKPV